MCNCSNFVESDDFMVGEESTMNFDGGGSLMDFGDEMEYDNFLTKKMRERRRVKKELMAGGLSKEEAKQKALEQVPRQTLKELLSKLKRGEKVDVVDTPMGQVTLDGNEALNQVKDALDNSTNTSNTTDMNNVAPQEAGFLKKNGMWIGIGAVVLIGGYFAWKKFGKK